MNYGIKVKPTSLNDLRPDELSQVKGIINNHLSFTRVKNQFSNEVLGTFTHSEIRDYLIQPNIIKNEREQIIFNKTDGKGKGMENIFLPNIVMVDIDYKQPEQRTKLIEDLNKHIQSGNQPTINNNQPLTEQSSNDELNDCLYTIFSNDITTIYCDVSQSNKGFKSLLFVISNDYHKWLENDYHPSIEHGKDKDLRINQNIHKLHYLSVMEYLKNTYQFTFVDDERLDYLDINSNKISQGTLTSNGYKFHSKLDGVLLVDNGDNVDDRIKEIKELKDKNQWGKVSINQITKLNNQFSERFKKYWDLVNKHPHLKIQMDDYLFNMFCDRQSMYQFLISLKCIDDKWLSKWFKLVKQNYLKGTIKKKNNGHLTKELKPERFKKYINGLTFEYITPISSYLSELNKWMDDLLGDCDLLGFKYNQILSIDGYLDKQYNTIKTIFDNNHQTILKSPTGTGKTTLIHRYICDLFRVNTKFKVVFVIPKNSLLEQQNTIINDIESVYNKMSRDENIDFQIIKNFGTKKNLNNVDGDRVLYLSSTPSLSNLYQFNPDLVIIDEIHNLVNYSDTILSNVNTSFKTIYISATPEPYLIGMDGFYYLNVVRNNDIKRKLNVVKTTKVKQEIKSLLDINRKQLIVWNDKEEGKKFGDSMVKDGFRFEYINKDEFESKTNTHILNIINSQHLTHTHYISTTFISDGINLLNKQWDDIIFNEGDLDFIDVYQFSNRFREVSNLNIYLISGRERSNDKRWDDIKWEGFKCDFTKTKELKNKQSDKWNRSKNNHLKSLTKDSDNGGFLQINGKFVFNNDFLKKERFDNFLFHYNTSSSIYYKTLEKYFDCEYIFKDDSLYNLDGDDVLVKSINEDVKGWMINNHQFFNELSIIGGDIEMMMDNYSSMGLNHYKGVIKEFKNIFNGNDLKLFISMILKRINELKSFGIEINEKTIKKTLTDKKHYKSTLTNLKNKSFGKMMNDDNLNGMNSDLWMNQNILMETILNSGVVKVGKDGNKYFSPSDLVVWFMNNKDTYNRLKFDDNHLFKLDPKSLGKVLNGLTRFINSKVIKTNGKSIRVYFINDGIESIFRYCKFSIILRKVG